MRRSGRAALAALTLGLVTANAQAQLIEFEDEEGAAGGEEEAAPPIPDTPVDPDDPAYTETADPGRFGPGSVGQDKVAGQGPGQPGQAMRETPKTVDAFAEVGIGFGQAPVYAGAADQTLDTTSFTIRAGGSFNINPSFAVGLQVPWTTVGDAGIDAATIDELEQEHGSQAALGSVELWATYNVALGKRSLLPIKLGVGLPTAQGDVDVTAKNEDSAKGLVNTFADAAYGWRHGELFQPGRLPITPSVGFLYYRDSFRFSASQKVMIAPDISDDVARPRLGDDGTFEKSSVSLRSVTQLGGALQFVDSIGLYGAVDLWLAYNVVEPLDFEADEETSETNSVFVFQPSVGAKLGMVKPSLAWTLPLGGKLEDMQALLVRADLSF